MEVLQHEHGKNMVRMEYRCTKLLRSIIPEMVAEPLAWGAYKSSPDTYFFACRYRHLSGDIPSPSDFPRLVAQLHKRGVNRTGEFGFPLTIFGARDLELRFPMSTSWEECFSGGIAVSFDREEETHGPDGELAGLREGIMSKVIPRLLRPLQTGGRTLTPRLCHGDLWDGNASVDVDTGRPMIFDAAPVYAHNECEFFVFFFLAFLMAMAFFFRKPSPPTFTTAHGTNTETR